MFDLTDKIALVTGGNGGIGLGMARGIGQAGATVIIVGRNAEKSAAALRELQSLGIRAEALACDVAQEREVQRLFADVQARHGRLDILVNNAGSTIRKPPQDFSLDDWNRVMDVNLTSAFLCARAAFPLMKAAGSGKIINIGSILSTFGAPYAPAYCASKGGIVQLTKSLALAWAGDGIQVNAVLPGWIDTELTVGARNQVSGLNERVLARTPAGRWGTPQDLAGIAVFLSSGASAFVTGAAIPVDGGYSAA
ncbi:SDR family NAD(P)-dependent oxidoreductase [Ramlibacter montanisoli]|uniref:SDR family oxidoreductase n=1 Tax=Ramlibacter montanisoli TaxID=2732512 RepID=A0A849KDN8_9BURK|nr:3-oxoacyl-ACP reductase FabG [Ramlibacter montanisoli]NNU42851.1 SDR family oxidoreductase [Ramlibacter montanisoli]